MGAVKMPIVENIKMNNDLANKKHSLTLITIIDFALIGTAIGLVYGGGYLLNVNRKIDKEKTRVAPEIKAISDNIVGYFDDEPEGLEAFVRYDGKEERMERKMTDGNYCIFHIPKDTFGQDTVAEFYARDKEGNKSEITKRKIIGGKLED